MFDIRHFIQYNKQRLGGRIFSPGCRKRLDVFVFARIAAESVVQEEYKSLMFLRMGLKDLAWAV